MDEKRVEIQRIPLTDGREVVRLFEPLEVQTKKEKDGVTVKISQTVKTIKMKS